MPVMFVCFFPVSPFETIALVTCAIEMCIKKRNFDHFCCCVCISLWTQMYVPARRFLASLLVVFLFCFRLTELLHGNNPFSFWPDTACTRASVNYKRQLRSKTFMVLVSYPVHVCFIWVDKHEWTLGLVLKYFWALVNTSYFFSLCICAMFSVLQILRFSSQGFVIVFLYLLFGFVCRLLAQAETSLLHGRACTMGPFTFHMLKRCTLVFQANWNNINNYCFN